MKKRGLRKTAYRVTALMLAALFCLTVVERFLPAVKVQAARNLTLSSAKAIAIANSEEIETLEMSVEAKNAAKESAVRSLKERERNMSTFRWSPLLSFKFPTKPNESEAFEFAFKSQQLQTEIREIEHKVLDKRLEIQEKVSKSFVVITEEQNLIAYNEKRLETLEELVRKLPAQITLGKAKQNDLDKANSQLNTVQSAIATSKSKVESEKKKLSQTLGIDVSQGYTFQDPFVSSTMKRSVIPSLVEYTLARDQSYYEASQNEALDMLALQVNYNLIQSKYRSHIGMISGYVQQSMDGGKVSKKQFKKDYDRFLDVIDAKWRGKFWILFISFPKEWIKGSLDGIRYVQDDPYILYQAALDYSTSLSEKRNVEREVTSAVEEGYENFITAKKAYTQAKEESRKLEQKLIEDEVKYILGEMEKEEYDIEKEEFEGLQTELNKNLSTLSETAYNFDRVTCGGASSYYEAESTSLSQANEVEGKKKKVDYAEGIIYTIRSIVSSQEFVLNVVVPEGFTAPDGKEINVTDFELWCDGIRIGQKTPVSQGLKHLTLTVNGVDEVKVRLFDGNTVITDCEIDPAVTSGPLPIASGTESETVREILGTYTLEDRLDEGRISAQFTISAKYPVRYYRIKDKEQDVYLYDESFREITEEFSYISVIRNDFAQLAIELYDENQNLLRTGQFDPEKMEIFEERQGD